MAQNTGPPSLTSTLDRWTRESGGLPRFSGASRDLPGWFENVEGACGQNQLPVSQWTNAAIYFLNGDLKHVMDERRLKYIERSGDEYWRWEAFQDDIQRLIAEAEKSTNRPSTTSTPRGAGRPPDENRPAQASVSPLIAASAATGLAVGGTVLLIPVLGILALSTIGFTAGGVAAGSLAAMIQSVFYGPATGGLFAIFQSLGATAALPSAGTVITSAIAGGAATYARGVAAADVSGEAEDEQPGEGRGGGEGEK